MYKKLFIAIEKVYFNKIDANERNRIKNVFIVEITLLDYYFSPTKYGINTLFYVLSQD